MSSSVVFLAHFIRVESMLLGPVCSPACKCGTQAHECVRTQGMPSPRPRPRPCLLPWCLLERALVLGASFPNWIPVGKGLLLSW